MKINLGCGEKAERGWINVDMLPLKGVDIIHNLAYYPWPFDDETAEEIKAIDILEHLPPYTDDKKPGVVAFIDECHRILKTGGLLFIQTPRYDADFLWMDPTHVRGFHERAMDFFDPDTRFGQTTGFYSKSKFRVDCVILRNKNLQFSMIKR